MLNKSHPLSKYKANSGKNKKKSLIHCDPDARLLFLTIDRRYNFCDKFSSIILSV